MRMNSLRVLRIKGHGADVGNGKGNGVGAGADDELPPGLLPRLRSQGTAAGAWSEPGADVGKE